ncbi:Non-specific lipid transfer protein GPI-anchored 31, partial [Linum grandiflorum]
SFIAFLQLLSFPFALFIYIPLIPLSKTLLKPTDLSLNQTSASPYSTMASYLPLFLVSALLFLSAANAAHHHSAAAPAPAADCSTVVLSLSDCLTYVLNGSTTTKPEGTCCSGLKDVLKNNAACLCQAFQSSGQLGVELNMTKALTLPSACKLQAPPMSACQLSMAPAGAPGMFSNLCLLLPQFVYKIN